ncbi:MAG: hypothetical protein Alpg2KO_15880 [Alphaproteobacteria bacterium]
MKLGQKRGVSVVEYGLLMGLISVVVLLIVLNTGERVEQLFSRTNQSLSDALGDPVASSTPFQPSTPCNSTGSQAFGVAGHAGDLNGQSASSFLLTVTSDMAGCSFTISVAGAGGAGGEAQAGGHGGEMQFSFIPDATGDFTLLVGQGGNFQFVRDHTVRAIGGGGAAGEYGTSGDDTAGGGGGASAIAFDGTVLAVAGGGGGGNSTPNCPGGGTVAQPGGNAIPHVCDGSRAGDGGAGISSSGSGGAGGQFTTDGGAGGTSTTSSAQSGNDGQSGSAQGGLSGGLGGTAVPAFLVSGGGGGAGDPDAGGGGGGGYGGGGGGGGDGTIVHGSGGAGGGGFLASDPRLTAGTSATASNGGANETSGGDGVISISW